MNFFTKIPISKFQNPIDYASKIVSLGSCFAENMGAKLAYYKFQNVVNPFGIIFNPVSIEQLISRAIQHQKFYSSYVNDCAKYFDENGLNRPQKTGAPKRNLQHIYLQK